VRNFAKYSAQQETGSKLRRIIIKRSQIKFITQFTRPVVLVALLAVSSQTMAAEVKWVKVKRIDGRIDVRSEIVLDAPAPAVYDALLEYDQFAELNENFTESHYIEPAADGTQRIYTKIEGCIWFFCRTVERYARLELEPPWKIPAVLEPEKSDPEMSIESWALQADGNRTLIDYSHEIETGFWVPPLIAGWIIGGTLKRSAMETAVIIEALALASIPETATPSKQSAALESETLSPPPADSK
jgi:hypothetical protein